MLLVSLSILWLVMLIQLALTLRIVNWVRRTTDANASQNATERQSELTIGAQAPDFKARTIAGQRVTLDDYLGRSVVFVFVSPYCAHCRHQMPKIVRLAPLAKRHADAEFVLVSDADPVKTTAWMEMLAKQDHVEVSLPLLVAPRKSSDFVSDYNPQDAFPYFCAIDQQGLVQVRDWVSGLEWNRMERTWSGLARLSPLIASRVRSL